MSAYIVNMETIEAIARGFVDYDVPFEHGSGEFISPRGMIIVDVRKMASDIGQVLLEQNYASVNYRYQEDTKAPKFELGDVGCTPHEIVGCIQCYNYQACETPNWENDPIFKSLQTLKEKIIMRWFTRYGEELPWGITRKSVPVESETLYDGFKGLAQEATEEPQSEENTEVEETITEEPKQAKKESKKMSKKMRAELLENGTIKGRKYYYRIDGTEILRATIIDGEPQWEYFGSLTEEEFAQLNKEEPKDTAKETALNTAIAKAEERITAKKEKNKKKCWMQTRFKIDGHGWNFAKELTKYFTEKGFKVEFKNTEKFKGYVLAW